MQIKKDEIRLSILNEAEKEFLENGFKNASLRQIVKSAGTTIGNFYNYFESKEALYEELVLEEYNEFLNFINNHNNSDRYSRGLESIEEDQWQVILSDIIKKSMPVFSNRFLILLEGSEGTRFENTKDMILKLLVEHFVEHINESNNNSINIEMSEVIAEQFLSGILLIVKKHEDEELRKSLMIDYILFYIFGTVGLLEK